MNSMEEKMVAVNSEEPKRILSERYVLEKMVGEGTWGKVFSATDNLTGQNGIAIKVLDPTPLALEQMSRRKIDEFKAVANESRNYAACANVVPGFIDIDHDTGKPFVVMPLYKKFLSDVLDDNGKRNYLGNGLDKKTVNRYMADIAKGLSEVHNQLKRAHCDLKPDNIALDRENGKLLINDFGTSTCSSLTGLTISPRDNMGFLQTRAPECFDEDSHPNNESDSYSFFSISYRLLTGKYPFEQELSENPDFFKNINRDKFKKIVENKLKDVPRDYRRLLLSCSDLKEHYRSSSDSILSDLEHLIENQNSWKVLKDRVKKVMLPSLIPSALLAGALYLGATYEPKETKIPDFNVVQDVTAIESTPQKSIIFDKENPNLLSLPKPFFSTPMTEGFDKNIARYVSNNRTAVALLNAYNEAIFGLGQIRGPNGGEYYSDAQVKVYESWRAQHPDEANVSVYRGDINHQIVARSIEYALGQAVESNGKVDLEDTLAIALEGANKIEQAKRAANSFNFGVYTRAKDQNGKYIISENHQRFLKQWLIQVYYDQNPLAFDKDLREIFMTGQDKKLK